VRIGKTPIVKKLDEVILKLFSQSLNPSSEWSRRFYILERQLMKRQAAVLFG
jgi:DNA gyrase inhibitor GyrI